MRQTMRMTNTKGMTKTTEDREKCDICSEFVDYCQCSRCETCEELTHVDLAKELCECGGEWL